MSWANIKELIFRERKMLEPSGPMESPQVSVFENQSSALLASYLKTKSQVDAAVRYFAHTLEWPEMTHSEMFFVVARLDYAWEIASILNTTHHGEFLIGYPAPDKCNTATLLEWLLIDAWPYGCGRFLEAQMEARRWTTDPAAGGHRSGAAVPDELDKAKCVA